MNLHYEKYGEHDQVLVILHGLFGSADNWTSLGKQLGRSFTVYLVDQRNHGKSPHSNVWNYTAMSNDLKIFLDDNSIHSPVILGHSMGGKTAMKFASLYPDYLKKLIIVDIAPKYYPVHHRTIINGLQAVAKKGVTSRKQADQILQDYINELPVRQFLLKNLVRNNHDDKMVWRLNLDVIDENIENIGEALNDNDIINTSTLFIRGGNSDYILNNDQTLLKKHFPNSSLETIENAGHWVHAEKPKEFLAIVNTMLT